MGEMADMLTEQYDDDWEHEQDDRAEGVRCKYCGRHGFQWSKTEFGWRLMTPRTGQLHTCKKHPRYAKEQEHVPQAPNLFG